MEEDFRGDWKVTFWTIFFSIIPLVLFNLALFIPEQRLMILGFLIISIIAALIFFYINKINYNEKKIQIIGEEVTSLKKELIEKFNYLRELYDLKLKVEMLEKKSNKKGQIDLLDIIKIIVAVILIYVIFQVAKSLY